MGRARQAPTRPAGGWGGAIRRMTVGGVGPSREDEARAVAVPGRYVPVRFARFVAPVVDPADYDYYTVAGWRVAVPRTTPGGRTKLLLDRIYNHGPAAAGYVRLGDTLVPALLEPGDRAALAQAHVEFEPWPLSP